MSESSSTKLLRLVPFCDSRCRLCESLDCRSEKLATLAEVSRFLKDAKNAHVLFPHNFAYHPDRDLILSLAEARESKVRLILPMDFLTGNRIQKTRTFADEFLRAGFEIEIIVESCESAEAFELIHLWNEKHPDKIHFTFQLSRDRGTYSSYENVRRAWRGEISLFSPKKKSTTDNQMTCDEIAEFIEDISIRQKNQKFTVAIHLEKEATQILFENLISRRSLGSVDWSASDFQNYFRLTMDHQFYQKNIVSMGSHRNFRKLAFALSRVSLLKKIVFSLVGPFMVWLAPAFATESRFRNRPPHSITFLSFMIRKPVTMLRGQILRYSVRSYYAVKAIFGRSWKIRVAAIRFYYWCLAKIDALQSRVNNVSRQLSEAQRNPAGYLAVHLPQLHFLLIKPPMKVYYFLTYQWDKRIRNRVSPRSPESEDEILRRSSEIG